MLASSATRISRRTLWRTSQLWCKSKAQKRTRNILDYHSDAQEAHPQFSISIKSSPPSWVLKHEALSFPMHAPVTLSDICVCLCHVKSDNPVTDRSIYTLDYSTKRRVNACTAWKLIALLHLMFPIKLQRPTSLFPALISFSLFYQSTISPSLISNQAKDKFFSFLSPNWFTFSSCLARFTDDV